MTPSNTPLLQGTLDMIVLQLLRSEPTNGYDLTLRIQAITAGRADRQRGVALSGVVPSGAQRSRQVDVVADGERSTRESVFVDRIGSEAPVGAARDVGAVRGCARRGSTGDVTSC